MEFYVNFKTENGKVEMKKCSVIIPMYKGKKYIEAAIESYSRQTYPCRELILMDDGSPDDTYDFVSSVIEKYPEENIRLYRQQNHGVAETRNRCVGLAEGEYVAFMDQDDTAEPDYLEQLMSAADDADIVICGYRRQRDDGRVLKTVFVDESSFSKYKITAPWARVYRKVFLTENGLKFLNTACGEDTYLTIQAYALTDKIRIIPKYDGYIWRYNESSVSNTKQRSASIANAACDTFERIVAALPEKKKNDPDVEYFFIRACLFYLLFSSRSKNKQETEQAYGRYFSFLDTHFPNYTKNRLISPFRPKGEDFSVRLVVWGFMVLKRLGISKTFVMLWSKLSK